MNFIDYKARLIHALMLMTEMRNSMEEENFEQCQDDITKLFDFLEESEILLHKEAHEYSN